jgi:electron transport complex protein RnfD
MRFETAPAPHLAPATSVRRVMLIVLVALVPGVVAYAYRFGPAILVQLALAAASALLVEALLLRARGRSLAALGDGSALVTAALLALCLPSLAPWWLVVTGTAFALVFGKHLYGGLGQNPFNPAMVGYVALLISFPAAMSRWVAPDITLTLPDALSAILAPGADPVVRTAVDAVTQATPLDVMRTELARQLTVAEALADPRVGGPAWQLLGGAWLLGGALLLATRTIRWQAPVGMLGALALLAAAFHGGDPGRYPDAAFHLSSGAALFGAAFIVTDPVSGAASPRGRLWFGIGVGVLTWLIRTYGGYPDGVAFAVLLMNALVPLLDRWTRPRAYGEAR